MPPEVKLADIPNRILHELVGWWACRNIKTRTQSTNDRRHICPTAGQLLCWDRHIAGNGIKDDEPFSLLAPLKFGGFVIVVERDRRDLFMPIRNEKATIN